MSGLVVEEKSATWATMMRARDRKRDAWQIHPSGQAVAHSHRSRVPWPLSKTPPRCCIILVYPILQSTHFKLKLKILVPPENYPCCFQQKRSFSPLCRSPQRHPSSEALTKERVCRAVSQVNLPCMSSLLQQKATAEAYFVAVPYEKLHENYLKVTLHPLFRWSTNKKMYLLSLNSTINTNTRNIST